VLVALLFAPSPSAAQITITYKGATISLREGFIGIAAILELYHYQQQSHNYTVFPNGLSSQFISNTLTDYFGQVGYQHGLDNYANYLGVVLPLEAVVKSRLGVIV